MMKMISIQYKLHLKVKILVFSQTNALLNDGSMTVGRQNKGSWLSLMVTKENALHSILVAQL